MSMTELPFGRMLLIKRKSWVTHPPNALVGPFEVGGEQGESSRSHAVSLPSYSFEKFSRRFSEGGVASAVARLLRPAPGGIGGEVIRGNDILNDVGYSVS